MLQQFPQHLGRTPFPILLSPYLRLRDDYMLVRPFAESAMDPEELTFGAMNVSCRRGSEWRQ